MSISFKKAMLSPYRDEKWKTKVGIAILLYVPGFIAALTLGVNNPAALILTFIASVIIGGFTAVFGHKEINNEEPPLPDWDFGQIITVALKSWLIGIVYFLMFLPLFIIVFAISGVDRSYFIISLLFSVPLFIFAFIFIGVAQSLFMKNLVMADAFNFKVAVSYLKTGISNYGMYLVFSILAGIIYGLAGGVLAGAFTKIINPQVGNLINNVTNILLALTTVNLLAQAYKSTTEKHPKEHLSEA